ncbi:helix-turn-helix domain-containing protein [Chelativorans salis]|uniref:Cupin domain-containing protein n=1 Tax=Chelativorans salis TaxID=2978478 RepID=A0ABT2LJ82_9HYPH|nr:cupin domain-containing protein [Chelativorans sp. EGI FJ00035]MCT7374610.1 cupin domain-containing protein [Chelativorans sp. EGI FJ00035]
MTNDATTGQSRRTASPDEERAGGEANQLDLLAIGNRLRVERERRNVSVRELARRINVSPSLISQVERGLVMPSVSTLWSVASELDLTIDELFSVSERSKRKAGPEEQGGPVQRSHSRKRIRLSGGVVWERLTAHADDEVEFLYVVYEPGAESCPPDSLFRHGGKEYAYVMSGRLGLQIGFEKHELEAGDSVSFNAQTPHRLWAIGDEPAVAIWAVINRTNDGRVSFGG